LVTAKKPTRGSRDRATPLMIGGTLFSSNGIGLVEAFQ
jgi:hypothetical protein